MSAAYTAGYAARWALFLFRLLLSFLYGVLQFISKPGSRWIVPVLLGIAMFLGRGALQSLIAPLIGPWVDWAHDVWNGQPSVMALAQRRAARAYYGYDINPIGLNASLVVVFLLLSIGYGLLSEILTLVLGAFPKLTRPLRPLRRLEPTSQHIKSARVEIAVPRLPR